MNFRGTSDTSAISCRGFKCFVLRVLLKLAKFDEIYFVWKEKELGSHVKNVKFGTEAEDERIHKDFLKQLSVS